MDCCNNISPIKCHGTNLKLQERPRDFSNFSLFSNNFWNKNRVSSKASLKQHDTSNFSNFHHTAYLESVQNVQASSKSNIKTRSGCTSPYLPKIPYLMRNPIQRSIKNMFSPRLNQRDQRSKNNRLHVATIFEKQSGSLNGITNQSAMSDTLSIIQSQEQKRNNVGEIHIKERQRSKSAFCLHLKRRSQEKEKNECNSFKCHSQYCINRARRSKSENLNVPLKTAQNFETATLNNNTRNNNKFEELRTDQRDLANLQRNVHHESEQSLSLILEQATDEEVSSINSQEKIEKHCNDNNQEKNKCISNCDFRNVHLDIKNDKGVDKTYISNQDVTISSDKSEINNSQRLVLNEDINNKGEEFEPKDVKFRVVTNLLNQEDFDFTGNVCSKPNNHRRPSIVIDIVQKDSTESFVSGASKRSSSVPPAKSQRKYQNPREIDVSNDSSIPNRSKISRAEQENKSSSLIDSIKTKVFPDIEAYSPDRKESAIWRASDDDQYTKDDVKFPKETKTAMMLLLSNSKRNSHLQLTSNISTKYSRLPCTNNLLCGRGIHSGECDNSFHIVTPRNCSENCICRRKLFWCPECQNFWPGSAKRIQNEVNNSPISNQDPLENMESSYALPQNRHCRTETFIATKTITSQSEMNGMNGHTNGELNGCDIITQNQQKGCWTIGLINSKFRYLTAETFGFKINANGASLKKKQIWTLEPDQTNGGESYIYLRSHLDKYLAVDSFGNVTCESDEKDPGCKFQISVAEDGTGRWAFRNVVRGYFLGSSSDKLTCTAKVPGDAEFWHVHLAARPQVNLRSVGRKRFAHLSENLDEIHVDANIPWGEDTLFTLEFRADESGKYALHTCNNKYLSLGGKLVDSCNKDCLFTAEYHSGQLALRDRNGAYLSPIGSKAVLKTRSNTVTKDELFSLEDSLPQASFVAALNSRYVSVKQGVDVTANQDEISDHETFQLEFDWSTKRWYIRTMQDRYWTLETGGGIQAVGDKRSSNALFDLIWQGDGSVAFRANNGRYVITKRSGHLYATADSIDENCKYFFYLINRPILVLKSEQGFVGYKSSSSPKLECNKATYETIQVERAEKGVIHFKGQNGKYWHCDSEGVTADSDAAEGFYLELREPTRLSIKSVSGSYLTASKNGTFRLGESSFETATQWEY